MRQVTVVIPAWNASAFIGGAIASALAQTVSDIEIIVVDDGSADGTAEAALAAGGGDPRLSVLRQDSNRGPSAARNRALDAAHGVYLAILDADDRMAPDRLERLLALAEPLKPAALLEDVLVCPEPDSAIGGVRLLDLPAGCKPRSLTLKDWVLGNVMSAGERALGYTKPLISVDFLRRRGLRYDETLRIAEDYDLILRLLAAGGGAWLAPFSGYFYWRRPGSLSKRPAVADLEALQAADDRLRAEVTLPAEDRAILSRRRRSLDDLTAFLRAREAVLESRWIDLPGALLRRPRALAFAIPGVKLRLDAALQQLGLRRRKASIGG